MSRNFDSIPTPCYIVEEERIIENLEILQSVAVSSGCRILLAQKGFSMYSLYPLIGNYLSGTTASSLFEARLGKEEMGGEVHIYSPAYREDEFEEILSLCDHIIFNSFKQWDKYRDKVKKAKHKPQCGIRVNPEYSEIGTPIYNPCYIHSRLGVTLKNFQPNNLEGIDGLHFHTLCEQNSDVLERTLDVIEENFGKFFGNLKWVNLGGGHHITREDYDVDLLVKCIKRISDRYGVLVYLEPGEAIALNAGHLVASVLDTVNNGMDIAILDVSAACHMPDVLEMPYRPHIVSSGIPGEMPHTVRLAGPTCLAGDIIGDYSFSKPLSTGDKVFFCDMAHYTMVKNNTFNGINLPAIALRRKGGEISIIRQFGYDDFKTRLS